MIATRVGAYFRGSGEKSSSGRGRYVFEKVRRISRPPDSVSFGDTTALSTLPPSDDPNPQQNVDNSSTKNDFKPERGRMSVSSMPIDADSDVGRVKRWEHVDVMKTV